MPVRRRKILNQSPFSSSGVLISVTILDALRRAVAAQPIDRIDAVKSAQIERDMLRLERVPGEIFGRAFRGIAHHHRKIGAETLRQSSQQGGIEGGLTDPVRNLLAIPQQQRVCDPGLGRSLFRHPSAPAIHRPERVHGAGAWPGVNLRPRAQTLHETQDEAADDQTHRIGPGIRRRLLAAGRPAWPSAEDRQLNIYNWADYIGPDTIKDFEKETGIKVTYDNFDSYETLDAKILTGGSGYDIIFPDSTLAYHHMKAGLYTALDKSKPPNFKANLDPFVLDSRESRI